MDSRMSIFDVHRVVGYQDPYQPSQPLWCYYTTVCYHTPPGVPSYAFCDATGRKPPSSPEARVFVFCIFRHQGRTEASALQYRRFDL